MNEIILEDVVKEMELREKRVIDAALHIVGPERTKWVEFRHAVSCSLRDLWERGAHWEVYRRIHNDKVRRGARAAANFLRKFKTILNKESGLLPGTLVIMQGLFVRSDDEADAGRHDIGAAGKGLAHGDAAEMHKLQLEPPRQAAGLPDHAVFRDSGDEDEQHSGVKNFNDTLDRLIELYDELGKQAKDRPSLSEPKRDAAKQAYRLLREYGEPPTTSRNGQFCRLAAVLYGDPEANLQPYCVRVAKAHRLNTTA